MSVARNDVAFGMADDIPYEAIMNYMIVLSDIAYRVNANQPKKVENTAIGIVQ